MCRSASAEDAFSCFTKDDRASEGRDAWLVSLAGSKFNALMRFFSANDVCLVLTAMSSTYNIFEDAFSCFTADDRALEWRDA